MTILLRPLFAAVLVLAGNAAVAQTAPRPAPAWTNVPIQSLEECPGAGIKVPGSSTCIRFSGSVIAETAIRSASGSAARKGTSRSARDDLTRSRAIGYVNVDTHTPTEAGDLRAYASVRVQSQAPSLVNH
jgi:hypothetical protein